MSQTISGRFSVILNPLESTFEINSFGRMSLNKTFEGPLSGLSVGEMLTARTEVESSAGYVAIERFEGELNGKKGSFVLQHFGVMHDGKNKLILEIIPNSGQGELSGISGKMDISRDGSTHLYTLEYEL